MIYSDSAHNIELVLRRTQVPLREASRRVSEVQDQLKRIVVGSNGEVCTLEVQTKDEDRSNESETLFLCCVVTSLSVV